MTTPNSKETHARRIVLESDEEYQVKIERPKDSEENKTYIDNIQFKFDADNLDTIGLYVSINKVYLDNLISGKESGVKQFDKIETTGRKYIYKKQIDSNQYFAYTFNIYDIQRSIGIFEISIIRKRTEKKYLSVTWRLHYKDLLGNWKSDSHSKVHQQIDNSIKIQWRKDDIMNFIQYSDIFLQVHITYINDDISQKRNIHQLCGLKNVGNTCYMNSFLQSLYYIRYLRKEIVEKRSSNQDEFVVALQEVFANLMKSNGKTVDPSSILNTKSWSIFQFEQRDIHEFKMQFFNQLQKIPQILSMFQGEMVSEVYCKDVDYISKTKIVFDEVELNVIKNGRKPIRNIKQSLEYMMQQQCLQADIQTQTHGLHLGYKKVSFTKLPPIVFFNLKRYEYNSYGLHKLLSKFQYESEIDLSFAIGSNKPEEYVLYSVLVHKGKSPTQGHYYSYINISFSVDKKDWYKFNDSYVYKVDEREVIQDNFGGLYEKLKFDKHTHSFMNSMENNITTAYILMYINKNLFEKLQNVDIVMPEELKLSVSQEEEARDFAEIKVSVVTVDALIQKNLSVFDIDAVKPFAKPMMLSPKTSMLQSTERILNSFKNGNIQYSVWKICSNKTILNLQKRYCDITLSTLTTLFEDNKHKPEFNFYILLVPNTNKLWTQPLFEIKNLKDRLCLVFNYITYFSDKQEFICSLENVEIIERNDREKISESLSLSEYDNNEIFQKNKKVIDLKQLNLSGKTLYCELVHSYMTINEDYFTKPRMRMQ